MSKHFYTDGIKTIKLEDGDVIPDGFYRGRTFNSNPWNKGLTKEDDDRIAKNAINMRETRIKGGSFISWNTGLTKDTCESLQRVSEKVSIARSGKSSWNKGIPATEEQKKKQSEAMRGRPSWNKGLSKETSESVKPTSEKLMGHECFVSDWEETKRKEYQTRKENGTINSSNKEKEILNFLVSLYGENDVIYQYFDKERYPFKCDFYIPSKDLFIEYHGTWTHGGKPFDENDETCIGILNEWKEKSLESKYYEIAVYNWTDLDVRKLETFRKNHLNFMVIYPNNLIITK